MLEYHRMFRPLSPQMIPDYHNHCAWTILSWRCEEKGEFDSFLRLFKDLKVEIPKFICLQMYSCNGVNELPPSYLAALLNHQILKNGVIDQDNFTYPILHILASKEKNGRRLRRSSSLVFELADRAHNLLTASEFVSAEMNEDQQKKFAEAYLGEVAKAR